MIQIHCLEFRRFRRSGGAVERPLQRQVYRVRILFTSILLIVGPVKVATHPVATSPTTFTTSKACPLQLILNSVPQPTFLHHNNCKQLTPDHRTPSPISSLPPKTTTQNTINKKQAPTQQPSPPF